MLVTFLQNLNLQLSFQKAKSTQPGLMTSSFHFEMLISRWRLSVSSVEPESKVMLSKPQVKERLATDHDRGLVALAVEKVMGLEEQILNVQPGNTPDDAVRKIAQDFQAQFEQSWRNFVDTRVIGILLIVRFLCLTTSSNIIGPAYYLVMISLVGPETLQGTDRQLLLALRAQFRTKIGG